MLKSGETHQKHISVWDFFKPATTLLFSSKSHFLQLKSARRFSLLRLSFVCFCHIAPLAKALTEIFPSAVNGLIPVVASLSVYGQDFKPTERSADLAFNHMWFTEHPFRNFVHLTVTQKSLELSSIWDVRNLKTSFVQAFSHTPFCLPVVQAGGSRVSWGLEDFPLGTHWGSDPRGAALRLLETQEKEWTVQMDLSEINMSPCYIFYVITWKVKCKTSHEKVLHIVAWPYLIYWLAPVRVWTWQFWCLQNKHWPQ